MLNLKERRQELGLTLENVGKIVGVGKSTVRKWETGYIENMGRDKIVKYSHALNISPMELLDPDNKFDNNIVEMITETSKQLTPDRQQNVYDYADSQLKEQQAGNVIAMPTKEPCSEVEVEGVLSAGIGEQLDDNSGPFTVMVPSPIPANYDHAFQVNGHSMEPVYPDQSIVFVKEEEEYRDGQVVAAIINDDAFIKKLSIHCGHATLLSLNPAYPDVKVDEDEGVRIIGVVFK